MVEPILSYELKSLINKIKQEYIVEFPIQVITPNYLMLAILEEKSCDGYGVISKLMMDSTIDEFKQYIIDRILIDGVSNLKQNDNVTFSDIYDDFAEEIMEGGSNLVTSSLMLNTIIVHDDELIKKLTELGVTQEQVNDTVIAYNTTSNLGNKEIRANKWNKKKGKEPKSKSLATVVKGTELDKFIEGTTNSQIVRAIPNENNIVEVNCKNLVRIASTGVYDNIVGFDKEIEKIFNVFCKYNRNTVAIVGQSGVGKTTLVEKLAKRLYEQNCPKQFMDKYIMKFDTVITSVVIKEMAKLGKYIAFIDMAENMFANKENEANNYLFLTDLFNTQTIHTIFTMSDTGYSKYVKTKPEFERLITKIDISEPDDKTLLEILESKSKTFENYNSVKYDSDALKESIRLSKRFITNEKCPASALNILDTAGAYVKVMEKENDEIIKLRERLNKIDKEKKAITNSSSAEEFDRKDVLIMEELDITKKINSLTTELAKTTVTYVTANDVKKAVSEMLNLPLSEMDNNEKSKLRKLAENLHSAVIGQDSAIEDITRAVKRQRIGLQNPDKPIVILFVGTTGVGKCVCGDTIVKIRNKKTNEIQEITLEELKKLQ